MIRVEQFRGEREKVVKIFNEWMNALEFGRGVTITVRPHKWKADWLEIERKEKVLE